mgnify:CR=1 FL=1
MRGVKLPKILVDSCGWIAIIDAGINIDHAIMNIFGSYQFIVIDSVWDELKTYQEKNKNKSILLDLLLSKSADSSKLNLPKKHTDDNLLFLSKENNWPVLTIDKQLKERLHKLNCKLIQVVGEKKIELVN